MAFWLFLSRIKQVTNTTKRKEFTELISGFLKDNLDKYEHLIIVSHGMVMNDIQNQLRKMGYKGEGFTFPRHGDIYEYYIK